MPEDMPGDSERLVFQVFARKLRHQQTRQEAWLWRQLRGRRFAGVKFRRQVPLGNYTVDFISFDHRLIIELDGGQHAERTSYDARRDAWLRAQGYRVLRFWNNELAETPEAVLEAIWLAVTGESSAGAVPLTPDPSPARGEGGEC